MRRAIVQMANAAATLLLAPSTIETPALVGASFGSPGALTSAAVVGSINDRTGAVTVESEEVPNRHASAPVPKQEIKGLQRKALFSLQPLDNHGGAELTNLCSRTKPHGCQEQLATSESFHKLLSMCIIKWHNAIQMLLHVLSP